jgi:hypothetical protein
MFFLSHPTSAGAHVAFHEAARPKIEATNPVGAKSTSLFDSSLLQRRRVIHLPFDVNKKRTLSAP